MNLYFTSHSGISISGNCNSACILRGIFICIAVFSVSTHLWNSHNIIEDFQILRLGQIPLPFLLFFFFLKTYCLISSVLVYLTHEWFRSVRGSPDLKIFYVGLKKFCVFPLDSYIC